MRDLSSYSVLLMLLMGPASSLHLIENNAPAQVAGCAKRHILYTYQNHAGIGDRSCIFNTLLSLGQYYNAKTYILSGTNATGWLTVKHSPQIHGNWSYYFDINANGGDPFHEITVPAKDCRSIKKDHNLNSIFDNGASCVNIEENLYHFQDREKFHQSLLKDSPNVLTTAQAILGGIESHGFIHIRRCDRMHVNSVCTKPSLVAAFVAKHPEVSLWVIAYYAEEGYKERLTSELTKAGARTLIFEDDLDFGDGTNDNYFRTRVLTHLGRNAAASYETQRCLHHAAATSGRFADSEFEVEWTQILKNSATAKATCMYGT